MNDIEQVFENVTAWLIEEVEKENVPWIKPWSRSRIFIGGRVYSVSDWPSNIRTPTMYYGPFNHVYLLYQMRSRNDRFRSNLWITAEALKELGVAAKGDPYFIFQFFFVRGQRSGYAGRFSEMYHVQQVEDSEKSLGFSFGIPCEEPSIYKKSEQALGALESSEHRLMVRDGMGYAAFDPKADDVLMPDKSQFVQKMHGEGEAHYWATMWHEVIHWTGRENRLDRHRKTADRVSSKENYALEELVAEIGAAYLCAHFGISGRLQHPQYIDSWLSVLKGGRGEALAFAFKEAQRAAKWIIDESRPRKGVPPFQQEETEILMDF